jgi:DNA-binding transcriptional LysR family regulator
MNFLNIAKLQPINSRQLLAFATVARTRSFTLAGKELFLSQSAVSHALTALEEELDCRLFDRDGKKLQITPAGEHLLYYAEKILADMHTARGSLQQRNRWGASQFRVAADAMFGPCLLPGVLRMFRKEFPDWQIHVKTGESRDCVEWLAQDAVEAAVTIAPNRSEAVEIMPLFTDELMFVVSPQHPWAENSSVNQDEISSQPLVCGEAASHTCRLVEKHFERDGVRLNWELELGSLEAIKEIVKEGEGVTVLAPWAVREELDQATLVALPLGKRKLKRNWCLLRSLNRKARLADEAFTRFCLQAVNELMLVPKLAVVLTYLFYLAAGTDSACFDLDISIDAV